MDNFCQKVLPEAFLTVFESYQDYGRVTATVLTKSAAIVFLQKNCKKLLHRVVSFEQVGLDLYAS